MQVLFAREQNAELTRENLDNQLNRLLRSPGRAYLYHFLIVVEIAAKVDAEGAIKAAKHLPTEADRRFSRRFSESPIISALLEDEELRKAIKAEKLEALLDEGIITMAYRRLKSMPEYQDYVESMVEDEQERMDEDRRIVQTFFEACCWTDEDFDQHLEDVLSTWDEDADTVAPRILKALESWKAGHPIDWRGMSIEPPEESVEFVHELLDAGIRYEKELMELIAPRLDNWEIDRISQMDRILIRMALSEMLYFPNIPVKVSINEYIDISKHYSTPRSKDFVNGVLDNLLQALKTEDRIKKHGRGLVE